MATKSGQVQSLISQGTAFCCERRGYMFWQYIKGLINKIHTAVRRNLEETLEVKTFLKMSLGFKYRGPIAVL